MNNYQKMKCALSVAALILLGTGVKAQNNWRHTRDDRKVAVEVDSLSKKGYSLIWINKDAGFNPALKEELIAVYFKNYPKLAKIFNKKTRKEVTFVIDPDYTGVAATAGGIVRFNPKWFVKNPHDIDVVTHEVMHIVQAYPNGSGPGWLVEGIADYVRYAYGVDNASANWSLPKLTAEQNYTNSYRIVARFLDWLEKTQKKGIVKTLDAAMRNKSYTDAIWNENTGKSLDGLWAAYQEAELGK